MSQCIYCRRDAFFGSNITPPICELHLELRLLIGLLKKRDIPVTVEALEAVAAEKKHFKIRPADIATLFRQCYEKKAKKHENEINPS